MIFDDVQQLNVQGLTIPATQPAPVIVLKDVPSPTLSNMKLPFENNKAVLVWK